MVYAQQVQGPHRVMLLGRSAGLVSHNLRHHASRNVQPLGQRLERAAEPVQRKAVNGGRLACATQMAARFHDMTGNTRLNYAAIIQRLAGSATPPFPA